MTTEEKLKYVESFRKLVVSATTYRSAVSHSIFLRGILSAWNADGTITLASYKQACDDLEVIMEVKRKLTANEGVGF